LVSGGQPQDEHHGTALGPNGPKPPNDGPHPTAANARRSATDSAWTASRVRMADGML
jgi:hypothetical protein